MGSLQLLGLLELGWDTALSFSFVVGSFGKSYMLFVLFSPYEVKYQCCTILRQAFNFKSTDVRKQEKVFYSEFWQCPGDLYSFSFYDFITHLGRFHYVCSSSHLLCLYFPL